VSGPDGVVPVLAALAAGEWGSAGTLAREAASTHPDSRLAAALDQFLHLQRTPGVYDEPSAFEAFIDHGANPELYRRTIADLRAIHAVEHPAAVVDIGCGDGRVVAAVLDPATVRVDLVEPSEALLGQATAAVVHRDRAVVAHAMGASELPEHVAPQQRWGIAESTFALHTTRPDERPALLAWLRTRVDRLVIVEFDVPDFADRGPEHLAYLAERYEAGVREYADHPEVVAGFLMPVLVGQLDPSRPRYTFEQPIAAWASSLSAAGFTVTTTPVFDYWWAPAVLLDARAVVAGGSETGADR
jgi:SAM-dependent methyltransferase